MPIYKPSELRLFLDEMGIYPKKGLSQNFLIDGNIIRKIVHSSDVQVGETVLEIGPGPGSLTQALLEKGAKVYAVEKDQALAQALERLQTPDKRLKIYCQDIMTFPLENELGHLKQEHQKAKVIANLPYHLTTPILAQIAPMHETFTSLTVMVQDEVARRLTAQPGTPEYSSFSLFVHFYSQPKYAFTVSPNCFYPIPKVSSAVVVLNLRQPPLSAEAAKMFFVLTRTAFEQRRKMLRSSLRSLFEPQMIEDSLIRLGLNPLARPETLSLNQFLQFFAILYPNHPK